MPPLPPALAAAFLEGTSGGPKRERTHSQLLHAAVQVICERGLQAATMQQVAQAAGVTTATLYNHFSTKDALVQRLAAVLAETLCRAINDSYAHIADGAERMAIGQRRYVRLAADSPDWTLLLLDVMTASPLVQETIMQYPLADLRLGVKQKKFKVPSEAAALDAINGICTQAMRRVALGAAPAKHDQACAALLLRALGMSAAEAAEVAARPLPPLTMEG
ncbi:TetR/AcrR family transcriptional regulator [Ramlibacter pallidus]|uniref:TetR/AcrR family transcriptional regulator n=1 Tax=Ramlibacter pallidus TaxID=2780087 RepID=A0ABR9RZG0_9BURK|nr:TetR/AcrR family transcriptional regulator [Ramlibacter pallidus]MBE7366229.1 TetR/AcrR family transcriptional regulator [Ramlibacter pallidus]